jgi:hypothetical protein
MQTPAVGLAAFGVANCESCFPILRWRKAKDGARGCDK